MVRINDIYYNEIFIERAYVADGKYYIDLGNGNKIEISNEAYTSLISKAPFKKAWDNMYYNASKVVWNCYISNNKYYVTLSGGQHYEITQTDFNNLIASTGSDARAVVDPDDDDIIIYNEGMQVDNNGDVTIGRDLYVEDEIIIDDLTKIADTDGNSLIWTGTQAEYDALETHNPTTLYICSQED